jgi:hypothetical protein
MAVMAILSAGGVFNYIPLLASGIALLIYPLLEAWEDSMDYPVKPILSSKYHRAGFIGRAVMGITCTLWIVQYAGWLILPVYAFYFSIAFDIYYNLRAYLPVFYVGNTAFLDRKLGRYKFLINFTLFFTCLLVLIINTL